MPEELQEMKVTNDQFCLLYTSVPEEHEFYDVAAQNENWEKLDAALTQIESRLQEIAEAKQ